VHDEPGRLVDDDHVVVFIDDRERHLLSHGACGERRRLFHAVMFARFDPARGVGYCRARANDAPFRDERLQPRARQGGHGVGEKPVESDAIVSGPDIRMVNGVPLVGCHAGN